MGFSLCVQTEGLSVNGTNGCGLSSNLSSNSSNDVPSKSCRRAAEALPRGMVVATTDLQTRSLYEEDEEQVGFATNVCPCA